MEYGRIARAMLSGFGFAYPWTMADGTTSILPTAYTPPGQVYLQYFTLLLFGSGHTGLIALYLFQIVEAVAFIFVLGRIETALFTNERVTKVTLWSAALYPPFIYATMTFGVTSSALLLNALFVLLGIRLSSALQSESERARYALSFGIVCGLLLLFRGESPVLIALTLVLIIYQNRARVWTSVRFAALAAIVAVTLLAPWTIRNYQIFHRFIPISTNGGFNFWRGNNAFSTVYTPIWATEDGVAKIEQTAKTGMDYELAASAVSTDQAWEWIKSNPSVALIRSAEKAAALWTISVRPNTLANVGYASFHVATLLLLIYGVLQLRAGKDTPRNHETRTGVRLIGLYCLLATLLAMVFFTLPRYQVLLSAVYFPLSTFGLSHLLPKQTR